MQVSLSVLKEYLFMERYFSIFCHIKFFFILGNICCIWYILIGIFGIVTTVLSGLFLIPGGKTQCFYCWNVIRQFIHSELL